MFINFMAHLMCCSSGITIFLIRQVGIIFLDQIIYEVWLLNIFSETMLLFFLTSIMMNPQVLTINLHNVKIKNTVTSLLFLSAHIILSFGVISRIYHEWLLLIMYIVSDAIVIGINILLQLWVEINYKITEEDEK